MISKRTILRAGAVALLAWSVTGVAAAQDAPDGKTMVDKIVASVGNSYILYSEVIEAQGQVIAQQRQQGYTPGTDTFTEAFEMLLTNKVLYNQALADSLDISHIDIPGNVETRVRDMVATLGSISAVEAYFHQPIYDVRDQMSRMYEEYFYAMSMRNEFESKVKVTPEEVERFYASLPVDSLPLVPEQYVYAQIMKYPMSSEGARNRVRERMLEMRGRILAGERFDNLARWYSMDTQSAVNGGEITIEKDALWPSFGSALEKLHPGQVSEIVETPDGFHIIELLEQQGNVYRFRHILLRPQYTAEELAFTDRFLDSLAASIRAGETTFAEAAMKYSDDKYSKNNGGVVTNHDMLEATGNSNPSMTSTRFFKEDLTPADLRVLSSLSSPDEVSAAFRSVDLRDRPLSKIIRLVEMVPTHTASIGEDYQMIEQVARAEKQAREFDEWLGRTIGTMYVNISPEFRGLAFENSHWTDGE